MTATLSLLSREPDPTSLTFTVIVDGRWIESWSLDEIKRAVYDGVQLTERSA